MTVIDIDYSRDGKVAHVTLDRPDSMNALNAELLEAIKDAFDAVAENDEVRVTILRGKGGNFSAGGDLDEYLKNARERNIEYFDYDIDLVHEAYGAVLDHPSPVLAVVEGYALAGGFEILNSCDLAVATEDAKVGDQHLNFGILPGGTGTQKEPRMLGVRRAKELMFTGRLLDAEEAKEWGIFNWVVPENDIDDKVEDVVDDIVTKSPTALRRTKYLVNLVVKGVDLETGAEIEREYSKRHMISDDVIEGLSAFDEGRDPVW